VAASDRTSADTLERHIPGRLVANSGGLACQDVLVQIFHRQHQQEGLLVPVVAEPLIVWIVSGRATVEERELKGSWSSNKVEVGDFFLTNSFAPYELRWKAEGPDPFEVMHLYLSLPVIDRAALEMTGEKRGRVAFKEVSGQKDHILSLLLEQTRLEITAGHVPSALFLAGLAQSLAVHIIRYYRDVDTVKGVHGALPAIRLRRVMDLMEAQFTEEFDLGRMAVEAGISAFHFSRVFKKATGLAPSQYFIRLRMSEARRLLRETNRSIIDIALDVGYSSPSHFAQIFRREVGVSPSDYRAT
jgi:AraC family transcriptional regulator